MPESENGPKSLKIYRHAVVEMERRPVARPTLPNDQRPVTTGSSRQYRLEQIRRERSEASAQTSSHRDGRHWRIASWLGKRSTPMEPTVLETAVQEFPSFKIYPPGARPRSPPAHETWTLDELLERWITRSNGELKIQLSACFN
jgi:hypothetical protein